MLGVNLLSAYDQTSRLTQLTQAQCIAFFPYTNSFTAGESKMGFASCSGVEDKFSCTNCSFTGGSREITNAISANDKQFACYHYFW